MLNQNDIVNLTLRFEALIGHLELRSVTNYEKDMQKALERIFISFLNSEDLSDLARRKEVARVIIEELKPIYGNLGLNIIDDMAVMAGLTSDVMKYAYGGSFVDKALKFNSKTTLFGFELGDLLKGNTDDAVKQFKRIVAQGLAEGKHSRTVYREFKKLGDKKFKHISRVLVGDAMKKAREHTQADVFKQLEKQKIVKGVEWLVTLEANTCSICRPYDGKRWKSFEAMIKETGGTSLHPRCRCSNYMITGNETGEKKRAGIQYYETKDGIKSRGTQYANMNYETWLSKQPKEIKNIINSHKSISRKELMKLLKV